MAEKINAYKTKDGKVYEDALQAATHDAEKGIMEALMLRTTPASGSVSDWAAFIVANAHLFYGELGPVMLAQAPQATS